ncbi:hypothetical protein VTK73DRAFT_411 [Phialemonium thermophilum]|uniref:Mid2 domain-containing protein n=1 Tax=Phialemonium thermophilum TaxID=223376 RepID=A0ABR3XF26_9PEZI
MTKTNPGSSLLQARASSHDHDHNHNHNHRSLHSHTHAHHQHAGSEGRLNVEHHLHSRSHDRLIERAAPNLDPAVTTIVKTISVVKYIDTTQSVTSLKTLLPDPVTGIVAQPPALTSDSSFLGHIVASLSAAILPSTIDGVQTVSSSSSKTQSAVTSMAGSSLTVSPSLSTSTPLTTHHSGSSSLASGPLNSTSRAFTFTNSTIHSHFINSTSSHTSSHSTSHKKSTWTTSTTATPVATILAGNGDGGGVGAPTPTSTASASEDPAPNSSSPDPTTRSVIGGVVGGVAGIALLALFLMFLLKWRKNRGNALRLLGGGGEGGSGGGGQSRISRLFGGGGDGGGASHGGNGPEGTRGMTERSAAFSVPAALASLSGQRRASQGKIAGGETSERGFYRVSGRKLTSVLQSGGDGYSDPHDSTISGPLSVRDSMAIFNDPNSRPLQLGSPMRPESGVMIMRSGPARTPVEEQNPFADDHAPSLSPPPLRRGGPSFVSQAGSHGSGGSRFAEDI